MTRASGKRWWREGPVGRDQVPCIESWRGVASDTFKHVMGNFRERKGGRLDAFPCGTALPYALGAESRVHQ
jgi:hypothetical protein